ncbi:hypothetical protein D3C73_1526580 [compost metagenome]
MLGSIVYRIVVALALRVPWLEASDLKLITAIIVIIALLFPSVQRYLRTKSSARRRTAELAEQAMNRKKGGAANAKA